MAGDLVWMSGSRRREAAVAVILAAAREEFLEHGPTRFTAERVARRAGCSRATLYRVVGGKAALIDAILTQGAAMIATRVHEAVDGLSGRARVGEALLAGLRELRADPVVHDVVRRTARDGDFLQRSTLLREVAAGWLDDGGRPGIDPDLAGDWILRVFLSLVAWPAPDQESERELVRAFVEPVFGR